MRNFKYSSSENNNKLKWGNFLSSIKFIPTKHFICKIQNFYGKTQEMDLSCQQE